MNQDALLSIRTRLTALRYRTIGIILGAGTALALATGLALALVWVCCEALFFFVPAWRTALGVLVLVGSGATVALFLKRALPLALSQHRFALFVDTKYSSLSCVIAPV